MLVVDAAGSPASTVSHRSMIATSTTPKSATSGRLSTKRSGPTHRSSPEVAATNGRAPRRGCASADFRTSSDRPEPTWLLPAERTKNGLPHFVPLVSPFAQLFAAAVGNRKSGPVFPSDATRDGILGEYTLRQAIARLFETGGSHARPSRRRTCGRL